MKDCIVRLLEIKIKNLKNVQNGSGKTALIEAMNIVHYLLTGVELEKEFRSLITSEEKECFIEVTFFIAKEEKKYIVTDKVGLQNIEKDFFISKEKLTCSLEKEGKWKREIILMDYDYDNENFITPIHRYKELIDKNKSLEVDLKVAKEISKKGRTSFIFSDQVNGILEQYLGKEHITTTIVNSLNFFAKANLYIILNEQLGAIYSDI